MPGESALLEFVAHLKEWGTFAGKSSGEPRAGDHRMRLAQSSLNGEGNAFRGDARAVYSKKRSPGDRKGAGAGNTRLGINRKQAISTPKGRDGAENVPWQLHSLLKWGANR